MTNATPSTIESTAATPGAAKKSPRLVWAWVLALTVLGLGLRFYDLTDQPLDFHPTRQLRSAIVARGMYYQMLSGADPALRQQAINFWKSTGQYEPSILEWLVANAYLRLGGEYLWVSRVFTSLFWVLAGLALFDLARRMLLSVQGGSREQWCTLGAALTSLAYYLVLPFAVQASRSFQPDPGMVMWIVLSTYTLYRWSEHYNPQEKSPRMVKQAWLWAILTGLLAGMAVLTKVVAAYIVAGAAVALVLYTLGLRRSLVNLQVWAMAILMVTPSFIYYLVGRESRASEYFFSWTVLLSHLLMEPALYVRWFNFLQSLLGMTALLLALLGVLIAPRRARALLLGLWVGYFIYGLTLPYQMYTHSYYHLQLVPIVALSLAPVAYAIGGAVYEGVFQQGWVWRVLFVGVLLLAIAYPSWVSISDLKREDNRGELAYWQRVGAQLPTDGKILALTQDYGYRLMYYGWRKVTLWPTSGEQTLAELRNRSKDFEQTFANRIQDKDYFLVTAFGQFNDQPELKQVLNDGYPVLAEGDGYVIYDLAHPKP